MDFFRVAAGIRRRWEYPWLEHNFRGLMCCNMAAGVRSTHALLTLLEWHNVFAPEYIVVQYTVQYAVKKVPHALLFKVV